MLGISTVGSNQEGNAENARKSIWFFHGPSGTSRREIWQWWQQRRFRYNRDLLLGGVLTWLLVFVAGSAAVKRGDDFEEPIMMIVGPVIYGIFANLILYGWPNPQHSGLSSGATQATA